MKWTISRNGRFKESENVIVKLLIQADHIEREANRAIMKKVLIGGAIAVSFRFRIARNEKSHKFVDLKKKRY